MAYRDVCREFGLTAASDETAWLIAADRAQEMGCEALAEVMRLDPTLIADWLTDFGFGYGSGSGSGSGSGDGSGDGSGSGDGDGSGDGYGSGSGSGSGNGYG